MLEKNTIRSEWQHFLFMYLKSELQFMTFKAIESDMSITKEPKSYSKVPIEWTEWHNDCDRSMTCHFKIDDVLYHVEFLTSINWSPQQFLKNSYERLKIKLADSLSKEIIFKHNETNLTVKINNHFKRKHMLENVVDLEERQNWYLVYLDDFSSLDFSRVVIDMTTDKNRAESEREEWLSNNRFNFNETCMICEFFRKSAMDLFIKNNF